MLPVTLAPQNNEFAKVLKFQHFFLFAGNRTVQIAGFK
jgi:hypothetical protein